MQIVKRPFPEAMAGCPVRALVDASTQQQRSEMDDSVWNKLAYEDMGKDLNDKTDDGSLLVYSVAPDRYAYALSDWEPEERAENLEYLSDLGGLSLRELLDSIMESLYPDDRDGDSEY